MKKARDAFDAVCDKAARRKGARPFEDIQRTAFDGILTHPVCEGMVQNRRGTAVNNSAPAAIRESVKEVWGVVSKPGVVASSGGFPLRRAFGAMIAGPGVKFKDAREFVGGCWKQGDFNQAQKRRAAFAASWDPELL